MKEKRLLVLSLLLSAIPSALTLGQDTVVVAINDTPPWKMEVNGKAEGIDINITDRFLAKLGLKAEYVMLPFARCLYSMETGETDLMGFLTYKEERKAYLRYFTPSYQADVKMFYVRKGEKNRLVKYEDLYSLKVGIEAGMKHFDPFDSDPKIWKEEVSEDSLNFRKLLAGRIDAVLVNDTQGPYTAYTLGIADQIEFALYSYNKKDGGFFAMSKRSRFMARFPEFEAVLRKMMQSGEIGAIITETLKKYVPKS